MQENILVQDSVIASAELKVQGINGQSSDWVELRDAKNGAIGQVLISICRESLALNENLPRDELIPQ